MKTIILYYSYSGKTKALALKKAGDINADIEEIIEEKKLSFLGSFFIGAPSAIKRKTVKIKPITANLNNYEQIIIMAPVWASHPAPAFNNIVENLPSGKKIEIIMVSAGGGTKKTAEKTTKLIASRGCDLINYADVKA